MKIFCYLFFSLVYCCAQSQIWPTTVPKDTLRVYLITRGTSSKTALIAQQFNQVDRKATHVGIGFFQQGQMVVYHVTNEAQTESALVKTTLEDFTKVSDIEYWAIWRCNSLSEPIAMLRQTIDCFKQPIAFDFDFNPIDDNKLYCSEFCAKALNRWNPRFGFEMSAAPLEPFFAKLLDREVLRYWPVDFFASMARFEKVFETYVVRQ